MIADRAVFVTEVDLFDGLCRMSIEEVREGFEKINSLLTEYFFANFVPQYSSFNSDLCLFRGYV